VSRPAIGNADVIDNLRVSPWGVRHSQASTRSLNRPGSLNRLISGTLSVALGGWLLGESFLSHIQTSMSDVLRVPSDSP
jgi:hypothetical protein